MPRPSPRLCPDCDAPVVWRGGRWTELAPDLTSYGTDGGTTDADLAAWAERNRPDADGEAR